ncbi:ATP cone domain-containing protein [Clostridium sp. KNHs214]|uniref:ATP cone domain-containing protein n=1 Tax=Clostridium sp. KNHs214 TaxID=1540257 RepID=UPI00054DE6C5|nr:ATP cone domain-containing protein [Clostridium sp. KNHs214]
MKVIKRDGRTQEFDISKIMVSIERSSDDAGNPMTSSDILNVSEDIKNKIWKDFKNKVGYNDIRNIVIEELTNAGFESVSKAYESQ